MSRRITPLPVERAHIGVFILLAYLWRTIATPEVRFPIIEALHLERMLVLALILIVVFGGRIRLHMNGLTPFLLLAFASFFLSHMLSPYYGLEQSQMWGRDYWKLLVFYVLLISTIHSERDLLTLFAGFAIIVSFYQLHSAVDFHAGGSFMWTQGIKRMIGVWSKGGWGSANSWGFLGLFVAPFLLFFLHEGKSRTVRYAAGFALVLSAYCITRSGTRAALVVFLLLLAWTYRRYILTSPLRISAVLLIAGALMLHFMPDEYKARYLSILKFNQEADVIDVQERIAQESANSRIEGLVDGWHLFLKRPIFGYGPETTGYARIEVNDQRAQSDRFLKLHNLYGQILSEIGLVGTLLFVLLMLKCWRTLSRIAKDAPHYARYTVALKPILILMVAYGMFSHNLFSYEWIFLLGLTQALKSMSEEQPVTEQELVHG